MASVLEVPVQNKAVLGNESGYSLPQRSFIDIDTGYILQREASISSEPCMCGQ